MHHFVLTYAELQLSCFCPFTQFGKVPLGAPCKLFVFTILNNITTSSISPIQDHLVPTHFSKTLSDQLRPLCPFIATLFFNHSVKHKKTNLLIPRQLHLLKKCAAHRIRINLILPLKFDCSRGNRCRSRNCCLCSQFLKYPDLNMFRSLKCFLDLGDF